MKNFTKKIINYSFAKNNIYLLFTFLFLAISNNCLAGKQPAGSGMSNKQTAGSSMQNSRYDYHTYYLNLQSSISAGQGVGAGQPGYGSEIQFGVGDAGYGSEIQFGAGDAGYGFASPYGLSQMNFDAPPGLGFAAIGDVAPTGPEGFAGPAGPNSYESTFISAIENASFQGNTYVTSTPSGQALNLTATQLNGGAILINTQISPQGFVGPAPLGPEGFIGPGGPEGFVGPAPGGPEGFIGPGGPEGFVGPGAIAPSFMGITTTQIIFSSDIPVTVAIGSPSITGYAGPAPGGPEGFIGGGPEGFVGPAPGGPEGFIGGGPEGFVGPGAIMSEGKMIVAPVLTEGAIDIVGRSILQSTASSSENTLVSSSALPADSLLQQLTESGASQQQISNIEVGLGSGGVVLTVSQVVANNIQEAVSSVQALQANTMQNESIPIGVGIAVENLITSAGIQGNSSTSLVPTALNDALAAVASEIKIAGGSKNISPALKEIAKTLANVKLESISSVEAVK